MMSVICRLLVAFVCFCIAESRALVDDLTAKLSQQSPELVHLNVLLYFFFNTDTYRD